MSTTWRKLLTTADEGSGNGLDADTVDGSHASAFATSGHSHSYDNYQNWTIQADSGGTTAINSTNNVQFIGGDYITTSRSSNNVTIVNDAPVGTGNQTWSGIKTFHTTGANSEIIVKSDSSTHWTSLVLNTNSSTNNYIVSDSGIVHFNASRTSTGATISIDNANDRLGVNKVGPAVTLDVGGPITSTGVVTWSGGSSTEANTAYGERRTWDGGAGQLNATAGRQNLALDSGNSVTFAGLSVNGNPVFGNQNSSTSAVYIRNNNAGSGDAGFRLTATGAIEFGEFGGLPLKVKILADDTVVQEWEAGATDITGNLDISGNLAITGNTTFAGHVKSATDVAGNVGYTGYEFDLNNSTNDAEAYLRLDRTSGTAFLGMTLSVDARDGYRIMVNDGTPAEKWRIDKDGHISQTGAIDLNNNDVANIKRMTFSISGATVDHIKDEDNMASNSALALATQQSIKAYVDAQAGGANYVFLETSGDFKGGTSARSWSWTQTNLYDTAFDSESIYKGIEYVMPYACTVKDFVLYTEHTSTAHWGTTTFKLYKNRSLLITETEYISHATVETIGFNHAFALGDRMAIKMDPTLGARRFMASLRLEI